jgi:hypothetical protein
MKLNAILMQEANTPLSMGRPAEGGLFAALQAAI